ncbi:hypothetical protein ABZS68_13930 [Streptomyces sp. NPDC005571]|uniref:hypothetical protein n=1 Tax=Streptomyces sp. NPDC005571 TaxID=3156888 RepID=UPI0033A7987A
MWNLQESRRRFYSEQLTGEVNYWVALFAAQGKAHLLDGEDYREFREWKPTRANCPELEGMLEDLIHIAPNPWKATLRNIFAARVINGEANATAWSAHQSGVVEINQGLTNAAIIYATLFSHFYDALYTVAVEVDLGMENQEVLGWILEEIDNGAVEPVLLADSSSTAWREQKSVYVAHDSLTRVPQHRIESYKTAIGAAEEFALAHEISHHLLGHTDESFRHSAEVFKQINAWIDRANIRDSWSTLNESQRQELEADIAAFLLMCGELSGASSRELIYKAISGSLISLIAISHINDNWHSENPDDSHPDFYTRYGAIASIVVEISKDISSGSHRDHPQGFLIQFRGFISIVLQSWASNRVESVKRPSFLNVFSWLLDEAASLEDMLQKR